MTGRTPFPWTISEARTADGTFMVVGGQGAKFGLIADVTLEDDALLIVGMSDASELLRIIARGVKIGHTGRTLDLRRGDLMTLAREYCDAHGLSYARTDLQVVEREGFLTARIEGGNRT